MKKKLLAVSLLLSFIIKASAQNDTTVVINSPYKIAVFAPLYLDSAFDGASEYRYAKNVFPKFINPGLEFYEGVQLALDSLSKEGKQLEVFVYDTRSAKETLDDQLSKPEISNVNLIIANCSGSEVLSFAEAGLAKKIPVINVTIPHDGGAAANPYFVILNPTLRTQCEGIYRYVQKYYSINPVVVFRKKGEIEDQIKDHFEQFSKVTMSVPLRIRYVDLPDSFTINHLSQHLDTVRRSLCIAGSLDPSFGRRLASQLASLNRDYPCVVVGMPTWDAIRDFNKPEFKGLEIIYSNPFYNTKTDHVSQEINNYFNNVMYSRPSDMVFRGYEVTWKFAKLLLQYGNDLSSNLSNKQNKVFTDFDIQPVLNRKTMALEYFENKKLYFLKWLDGTIKVVN